MSFFEEIGRRVTDAGKGVSKQAKNFADTARLNSSVEAEQRLIEQKYAEIGNAYYAAHKDDAEAEFAAQIEAIRQSEQKIAQWKEQILQIKGVIKCPSCGADIPYNSQFCGACGAKIVREAPAPVETAPAKTCPQCGAPANDSDRFCNKCGAPLE